MREVRSVFSFWGKGWGSCWRGYSSDNSLILWMGEYMRELLEMVLGVIEIRGAKQAPHV
jgi:hypothetical protein